MNVMKRLEVVRNLVKQLYIKPEAERIHSYATVRVIMNELREQAEIDRCWNPFVVAQIQDILWASGALAGIEDKGGTADEALLQTAYKAIKSLYSESGFNIQSSPPQSVIMVPGAKPTDHRSGTPPKTV